MFINLNSIKFTWKNSTFRKKVVDKLSQLARAVHIGFFSLSGNLFHSLTFFFKQKNVNSFPNFKKRIFELPVIEFDGHARHVFEGQTGQLYKTNFLVGIPGQKGKRLGDRRLG